jgi:hypothetical protein
VLAPGATAAGPPDHPAGWTRHQTVWSVRTKLPSQNLCTIGEFVERRLDGRGLDDCRVAGPADRGASAIDRARQELARASNPPPPAGPAATPPATPPAGRGAADKAPPATAKPPTPAPARDPYVGTWRFTALAVRRSESFRDFASEQTITFTIARTSQGYTLTTENEAMTGSVASGRLVFRDRQTTRDGTVYEAVVEIVEVAGGIKGTIAFGGTNGDRMEWTFQAARR